MDFKEVYPHTCSSVFTAAKAGNHDLLLQLIAQGKDVDVKNNQGWISLHAAAAGGHVHCLDAILKQDVDVDCKTFEEETALLLACKWGHTDCVRSLLAAGANPSLATLEDLSPLYEASGQNVECVELLLGVGANTDCQTFVLDTPLHRAVEEDKPDIVACLLKANLDPLVRNEVGLTPLFVSAQFGRLECMQQLINGTEESKVNQLVNMAAQDKATPLYIAAQERHGDCVKLLLDHGANPDLYIMEHNRKMFPLTAALYVQDLECTKLLLGASDLSVYVRDDISNKNWDTYFPWTHPVVTATWCNSSTFMECVLRKQEIVEQCLASNNLHSVLGVEGHLRPKILFAVRFHEQIRKACVLKKCEFQDWLEFIEDDEWMLCVLLAFRMGGTMSCFTVLEESVLMFEFATLKYKLRKFRGQPCRTLDIEKINLLKEKKIYSSNFFKILSTTTHRLQAKRALHEDRPGIDSLQCLSRRAIVLIMINSGCYQRKCVSQLGIATLLQEYLLFPDLDKDGALVQASESIEAKEAELNTILDETDTDQVLPRQGILK